MESKKPSCSLKLTTMENFNWKSEVLAWTQKQQVPIQFNEDLIDFFTNAFNYNLRPDEALFGTNDYSVSLLVGNIYFAALAKDGFIWLLIDSEIDTIPNSSINLAKAAKKSDQPLYWFGTKDLNSLKVINADSDIWQSYKRASCKIFENRSITARKPRPAFGKRLLNSFWTSDSTVEYSLTPLDLDINLQQEIAHYEKLSRKERLRKLKAANPKAEITVVTQYGFKRNALVILEVLDRANGYCERCKKQGPFLKDKNGKPYLEVHHIISLADNGDDTIENTLALCANCHRHAHHGKSSY